MADSPECVPVPSEHRRILDERLAEFRANPQAGRPWTEVREQLLARIRRS
ncbi:MAG: addiction module protein [Gammaproteobacteria bacterium]|nr:addiction module protein [Gammaproteobacteria bacterium]